MNHRSTAKEILNLIGTKENIESFSHCVTRLRFNLKKTNTVDQDKIKKLPGVLGVNQSNGQLQVIIGKEVSNFYNSLLEIMEEKEEGGVVPIQNQKRKSLFDILSGIFVPIFPTIAGIGIIKSLLVALVSLGWISSNNEVVLILSPMYDITLHFLPVIIAISTAHALESNQYVAGIVSFMFLQTSLFDFGNNQLHEISLFANMSTSTTTVFSSMLIVWFASRVERILVRKIPNSLHLLFVPALTLIVVIPLTYLFFNPLGFFLGEWLSQGFDYLYKNLGALSGILFGVAWTFFIMSGMHYILIPILLNNLANLGFDYLYVSAFMMNMAHAGAALSVYLYTKDSNLKSLSLSSSISALIGITEPALFGVNMKIKQAFIAALLGGSMGGICSGVFNVKFNFLTLLTGIPGINSFVGPTFVYGLLSMLVSFVGALLIGCFLLYFKKTKKTSI